MSDDDNSNVAAGVAIAAGGTAVTAGTILATAGTVATGACLSGVCAVGAAAAITGGVGAAIGSFFASPVVAAGLVVVGVGLLAWGGWKLYKGLTEPNVCEVVEDVGANPARQEDSLDFLQGVGPAGFGGPRQAPQDGFNRGS